MYSVEFELKFSDKIITFWARDFVAVVALPVRVVVEWVDGQHISDETVFTLDGTHEAAAFRRIRAPSTPGTQRRWKHDINLGKKCNQSFSVKLVRGGSSLLSPRGTAGSDFWYTYSAVRPAGGAKLSSVGLCLNASKEESRVVMATDYSIRTDNSSCLVLSEDAVVIQVTWILLTNPSA